MGKKKSKELETTPKSDAVSASPDIFKTLFGDAGEKGDAVSIFSDDNPFRRKTQEPGPVFDGPMVEDAGICEDGGSAKSGVGELQKRKRTNENKFTTASEASEVPLDVKKSKGGELRNPNSQNPNLSPELASKMDEKKRKRKRDELERDYEVRKYGTVENAEDGEKGLGGEVGKKRKAVDNPADMLVSKEGFDDESKLLRTVFVGNLPLTIKKKALIKEFSKFGEVESVRIRSVPISETKKPRRGAVITKQFNETADSVHAYIVFKTEESAQASLSHNLAVIGGHHIRVDRACPPRKKLKGDNTSVYDHKRTVFVGNLPFDAKDEEVYQLFCGIKDLESSIEAFRVIRDPQHNVGKGFAYVLFKTREAANLVVKKRNLKLRDRELRLYHSKPNSTPSKRSSPSPAEKSISPAAKRPRTPDGNKAINMSASKSYQGLRASKSGVQKKVAKTSRPDKVKSNIQRGAKERKEKRPAVAARKAKATALQHGGGASKQAGAKRVIVKWNTWPSEAKDAVPQDQKIKPNKPPATSARKQKLHCSPASTSPVPHTNKSLSSTPCNPLFIAAPAMYTNATPPYVTFYLHSIARRASSVNVPRYGYGTNTFNGNIILQCMTSASRGRCNGLESFSAWYINFLDRMLE
ncbi:hypothetical protein FNV43_RR10127 [Rhamnella rubrinervis]|uniref:RRM domain-containing protein n=1 Tax=Rhamnella rubrinervis TaxID=2594499 RepID=A0A8K0HCJ6_9ROSA|nr:hypothetical protein FNV43_RR10127 [Rhamnella rubrinervis]